MSRIVPFASYPAGKLVSLQTTTRKKVINQMNTDNKELYEAPSMLVFEVRQEGVICISGGEYPEWPGEII